MKQWLAVASEYAIVLIDGMALIVILFATIEAFVRSLGFVALRSSIGSRRRDVWLRYARWLVAGLTFQLAADIVETTVTTSSDAVGRIAAIAAVRTFLNHFLDRDLAEVRDRQTGFEGPGTA